MLVWLSVQCHADQLPVCCSAFVWATTLDKETCSTFCNSVQHKTGSLLFLVASYVQIVAAYLLVFRQVTEQVAVRASQQLERLCQVVVLQRAQVVVLDCQAVAGLDEEIVVEASVVQVMTHC